MNPTQIIEAFWQEQATLTDLADALQDAEYTRTTKPVIQRALKAITQHRNTGADFPELLQALDAVVAQFGGGQ